MTSRAAAAQPLRWARRGAPPALLAHAARSLLASVEHHDLKHVGKRRAPQLLQGGGAVPAHVRHLQPGVPKQAHDVDVVRLPVRVVCAVELQDDLAELPEHLSASRCRRWPFTASYADFHHKSARPSTALLGLVQRVAQRPPVSLQGGSTPAPARAARPSRGATAARDASVAAVEKVRRGVVPGRRVMAPAVVVPDADAVDRLGRAAPPIEAGGVPGQVPGAVAPGAHVEGAEQGRRLPRPPGDAVAALLAQADGLLCAAEREQRRRLLALAAEGQYHAEGHHAEDRYRDQDYGAVGREQPPESMASSGSCTCPITMRNDFQVHELLVFHFSSLGPWHPISASAPRRATLAV
mmetsp:Transcript_86440/g.245083  ORF Transcript_86440/g.245083 Transcript_86440/m.245083 type:complete len:352 (-) Transcript_86440:71-1126(-)